MRARHTTAIVAGSCGVTPKSSDRIHEPAPSASGTAAATPTVTGRSNTVGRARTSYALPTRPRPRGHGRASLAAAQGAILCAVRRLTDCPQKGPSQDGLCSVRAIQLSKTERSGGLFVLPNLPTEPLTYRVPVESNQRASKLIEVLTPRHERRSSSGGSVGGVPHLPHRLGIDL
jgi:hypothetical protein